MKDINVRYLNTGRRSLDFADANGAAFPARSRGSELIAIIRAAVTEMETQGARQEAAERARKEATEQKKAARAALLEHLRRINRTARGMKKRSPGIASQFAMPRTYSDQAILDTARAFHAAATPITDEFTGRGLPSDFLTALDAAINRMTSAIDAQDEALREQTSSTAAVNAAQGQLIDALGEFSPIVTNQFQNDPATLAAWKSASRVERAPQRTKTAPTPPPAPPTS